MIIGTAGHIDHGKSALVRALTGREMDRLQEERRRGITIDLNFAPLEVEGQPPIGIVDVPGHEDFVRTMVAGASGVDLVLLVIDAAEGIKPQTREHLAIVEQLGVPDGIPVLAKCDLVDEEWLELVEADLAGLLARSPVRFGPPARVSSVTGAGIAELRERLAGAARSAPVRKSGDLFRMPVDRAFSLAGVGTVLTGTAWTGTLVPGDSVRLLPSEVEGRVRSLASHDHEVASVAPGSRTAVGVAGIERGAVRRGEVLVAAADDWTLATALDVRLELLPSSPRPLTARTRLRVHLGTAEILARAYPREQIVPGGRALCRLALEVPAVARAGDRIVIRSYSPLTTIGGGVVLDPAPPRRAPWPATLDSDNPGARLLALLERRPDGLSTRALAQWTGLPPLEGLRLAERTTGIRRIGERWVPSSLVKAAEAAAVELLARWHREHPLEAGISQGSLRQAIRAPEFVAAEALRTLERRGEIAASSGLIRLQGFQAKVPGGTVAAGQVEAILVEAGLQAPAIRELEALLPGVEVEAVLRLLAREGVAERVAPDRYFAASALEGFEGVIREMAAAGQEVTPAALRDRLGLTRKYLIPLLEWADRKGITRREGDRRVVVAGGQADRRVGG
jgi:selenocysteine-specific elongation factor